MTFDYEDYSVGWISALPIELAAAKAMFDGPPHPVLPQKLQDTNTYVLGRIGPHNVVLTCLPSIGTNAAAHAAANLLRSFPNVKFGLMVGIGGGVPGSQDIRLGDVIVSDPKDQHGGVIQYDYEKISSDDGGIVFERTGHLNRPPSILLGALRHLEADAFREPDGFMQHYDKMLQTSPTFADKFRRPVVDELFNSLYLHKGIEADCTKCSREQLIPRLVRTTCAVHYGLIGSANYVLKNATKRNELHATENIICFETEAAGLMNEFSCIVIRGVCDYCDSHKNNSWQAYASAAAAAYAKELLLKIASAAVEKLPQITNLTVIVNRLDGIQQRLDQQADTALETRHRECLDNLRSTDPRVDRDHLLNRKGNLLRAAYIWILNTEEYRDWQTTGKLLWISGLPGKGKTMLLCGIIDELDDATVYFFCQGTVDTNNTSTSVLRGIVLAILIRWPRLSPIVDDKIHRLKDMQQNRAFYALAEILETILAAQDMNILIDALDECSEGRNELLQSVVKWSDKYSSRWIISSRPVSDIVERLREVKRLSLEKAKDSLTEAVETFITIKVDELSKAKQYDETRRALIYRYLLDNAQGTFLWVSLVCSSLSKVRNYQMGEALLEDLKSHPADLDKVYERMLRSLSSSQSVHQLQQIIAVACTVLRPISLDELSVLIVSSNESKTKLSEVEEMVNDCGCFFTLQNSIVELIHQSAKDFLMKQGVSQIFPGGIQNMHHHIFTRSMHALGSLKKNMYGLTDPAITVKEILKPEPDPLGDLNYSSTHWIDHLLQLFDLISPQDLELVSPRMVSAFLRAKYIYWLEALSLLEKVYPALLALTKLIGKYRQIYIRITLLQQKQDIQNAVDIIQDAIYFIRYFQYALISFPMQIYISGLLFSPKQSLSRRYFSEEAPEWVRLEQGLQEQWPNHLTLATADARKLRWSADSRHLAIHEYDKPVITVWDADSGELLASIDSIHQAEFVFVNSEEMIIYDRSRHQISTRAIRSSQLTHKTQLQGSILMENHTGFANDVWSHWQSCFSQDTSLIARAYKRVSGIEINCTNSGVIRHNLTVSSPVEAMVFNVKATLIAVASTQNVSLYDLFSKTIIWTTVSVRPRMLAFSPDTGSIAIASEDIEVWQWSTNKLLYSLERPHHTSGLADQPVLAFHPTNSSIIMSQFTMLKEITVGRTNELSNLGSTPNFICEVIFSPNGHKLATTDSGSTKIWNTHAMHVPPTISDISSASVFDHIWIRNGKIHCIVDNTTKMICIFSLRTLDLVLPYTDVGSVLYNKHMSPDGSHLLLYTLHGEAEVWALSNATRRAQIDLSDMLLAICWGPGPYQLTVISETQSKIFVWDIETAQRTHQLPQPHELLGLFFIMCWSTHRRYLVISGDGALHIFHTGNGEWRKFSTKSRSMSSDHMLFSSDDTLFAHVNGKRVLEVFRLDTLEVVLSIPGYDPSYLLSFDDYLLKTELECFNLAQAFSEGSIVPDICPLNTLTLDSNSDDQWMRSGSDKIIWLPQDYRPCDRRVVLRSWAAEGPTIVIGCGQGRLVVLNVDYDEFKRDQTRFSKPTMQTSSSNTHKRGRSSTNMPARRVRGTIGLADQM